MKSVFNTKFQQKDLTSKIVVGLQRLSEVFKSLIWEHAKVVGLSPIQIQILIFIAYHDQSLCNVSHLAREFDITKPTVSDAIKVLLKKDLVKKLPSTHDSRRFDLSLTLQGQKIVNETESFANPIKAELDQLKDNQLEDLYASITQVIYGLNKNRYIDCAENLFWV